MILAFDLATVSGVAIGSPLSVPKAWSVDLGAGMSDAHKWSKGLRMTRACIAKYEPSLVVVEAAIGGPKSSQFLVGLMACVLAQATDMGVPVKQYHLGSIRKHFLGSNPSVRGMAAKNAGAAKKAIKGMVMHRCRSLGWSVVDDNAADACALWDYATSLESAAHAVKTAGGLWN